MTDTSGGEALRVVVADDDEAVRTMLRAWLGTDPRFVFAGETEDGLGVRPLVADTTPDAVILDLSMPNLDGLAVLADLRAAGSDVPVVVYSAAVGDAVADTIRGYENSTFVAKGVSLHELGDALARHQRPPADSASSWSGGAEAAAGVMLLSVAAAVVVAIRLASSGPASAPVGLTAGFAIAIAATYALPVRRLARSGRTAMVLDGHLFIALSMVVTPAGAAIATAAGAGIGLCLARPRRRVERVLFTTGLYTLLATSQTAVVQLAARGRADVWVKPLAAAGAYSAALAINLVLVTAMIERRQGVPAAALLRRHVPTATRWAAAVAVPVGVVVGAAGAARPSALLFLVVPQLMLLAAVRSDERTRRERDALRAVVEASRGAHQAATPGEVEGQLLALAHDLVDVSVAVVQDRPASTVTSVSLDGAAGPWLTGEGLTVDEVAILDLIAAIGAPARENARLRSREMHDARHDPLTGVANHRLMREALDRSARSYGQAGTAFAVLYVDLDGFKAVNDTYGHGAGDEVLKEIARRLQRTVRPFDLVARPGGDEFVVIVSAVGDHAVLARVVEDTVAPSARR